MGMIRMETCRSIGRTTVVVYFESVETVLLYAIKTCRGKIDTVLLVVETQSGCKLWARYAWKHAKVLATTIVLLIIMIV